MNLFDIADILYEDDAIIVCRKHAGMAVQSARTGQMDLESALRNYFLQKQEYPAGQRPYVGIIQRLDQPVEGVLVFAKTPAAAKELNRQMGDNKITKRYLAVVCTKAAPAQGELVDYLLRDGRDNTSKVVPQGTSGSKRAELRYQCLRQESDYALLEIELKTGRHHQIRVQLAHAGMAIAGDRKYNHAKVPAGCQGLALCAHRLDFSHPVTGQQLTFTVEPENVMFHERKKNT